MSDHHVLNIFHFSNILSWYLSGKSKLFGRLPSIHIIGWRGIESVVNVDVVCELGVVVYVNSCEIIDTPYNRGLQMIPPWRMLSGGWCGFTQVDPLANSEVHFACTINEDLGSASNPVYKTPNAVLSATYRSFPGNW